MNKTNATYSKRSMSQWYQRSFHCLFHHILHSWKSQSYEFLLEPLQWIRCMRVPQKWRSRCNPTFEELVIFQTIIIMIIVMCLISVIITVDEVSILFIVNNNNQWQSPKQNKNNHVNRLDKGPTNNKPISISQY